MIEGVCKVMEQQGKNSLKAAEDKWTSYLLIVVGAAGEALNILSFAGVIHLPIGQTLMQFVSLSILLIVFFVFGILSLKGAKELEQKGAKEDEWIQRARKFCEENLTKEAVDAFEMDFDETELSQDTQKQDDEKQQEEDSTALFPDAIYFERVEKMKCMIRQGMGDVDEDVLDEFADSYYAELFDE